MEPLPRQNTHKLSPQSFPTDRPEPRSLLIGSHASCMLGSIMSCVILDWMQTISSNRLSTTRPPSTFLSPCISSIYCHLEFSRLHYLECMSYPYNAKTLYMKCVVVACSFQNSQTWTS